MSAALSTKACELLGCEYPIVLAGMGGVARSKLVAAVTEAGGFGFLGMVREPPSLIEQEVLRVRENTDRPFGVNLIPSATPSDLLDAEIETCLRLSIPVVTLFWDVIPDVVARFKDAGVTVVYQVGSAAEAREAEGAGADILIVQGKEAGGHVRGTEPLRGMLPDIMAATRVPVLAAGGLTSGRDLVDMLALGAHGIVLGTAFMATTESFAHDYHKHRLIEARGDDTLLTTDFHINWPPGAPVRVIANSVTRGERGDPYTGSRQVIGEEDGRPIYLFSTDSPLANMTGDFEAMALYAGQGVGQIDAIVPAGERVHAIVSEAIRLLQEIP